MLDVAVDKLAASGLWLSEMERRQQQRRPARYRWSVRPATANVAACHCLC
jgi:hypothetical protein